MMLLGEGRDKIGLKLRCGGTDVLGICSNFKFVVLGVLGGRCFDRRIDGDVMDREPII